MILLLAGTTEAREVAQGLAAAGIPAMASLAGTTHAPAALALPTRMGGWGGGAAFAAFLQVEGITGVIDATHPFAARITERSARICAEAGVPYLRLQRPEWQTGPGDDWHAFDEYAELARLIPEGARVLAATGRGSAEDLRGLGETRHVVLRVIDEGPLPGGIVPLVARPPFDLAAEVEVLRTNRIDWLVAKNAGGLGGRAKLEAARSLDLPVAMMARPTLPDGIAVVQSAKEALTWTREVT